MGEQMLTERKFLYPTNNFSLPRIAIDQEERNRQVLEPIRITPELWQQARQIGELVSGLIDQLPNLLANFKNAQNFFGLSKEIYHQRVEPFLETPFHVLYFGVDAVLSDGSIKIVEINPQAASLGSYDQLNQQLIGANDPNAEISPSLLAAINQLLLADTQALVISHPNNVFHLYHQLLAQQMHCRIAALQDLTCTDQNLVSYQGKKVGLLFKQFSNHNLFTETICASNLLKAIQTGKVLIANSPLFPFFGDKVFLAKLGELEPALLPYLPEMRVIGPTEAGELFQDQNNWLKGDTRGGKEITLNLAEYRGGWKQRVIEALVRGDYDTALHNIPEASPSKTVARLKRYILDLRVFGHQSWLLQKHYPAQQITTADGQSLNTLMRMYFVRNPANLGTTEAKTTTFIEFFASAQNRVSAAGYTIPVRSA